MSVLVLGPPVILANRVPRRPSRRMARVLLGMFALRPNRPLSLDWIVNGLWLDEPPPSAAANVRSHIAELRRLLNSDGPRIDTADDGYLLAATAPGDVDALWFHDLLREGRRHRAGGADVLAARCYAQALALWRGDVLAGVAIPPVVQPQVEFLDEERLSAVEELVDVRMALGQQHDLVPELKALVIEHPLRERLWHQLLLALSAAGRRGEVVHTYRRLVHVLDTELSVRPSPAVTELYDMIRRGDA